MRERFPSDLEQDFHTDFSERNIGHHQKAILGILVISLASGPLNVFNPLHVRAPLLTIHYLVLCPVLLSIYCLSLRPTYRCLLQQIMIIGVLAYAATYLVFEAILPTVRGSEASRTTFVLIDIVLATCAVLKLRQPYVVRTCCVLFGVYLALSLTVFHIPSLAWNALALFTACVLGCLGSSFMEQGARTDFLLRRELQAVALVRLQAARDVEHEIKNKLISISLPIQIAVRILGRDIDSGQACTYLQNALGSVKELEGVLQLMLNIARMEAGHEPVLEVPEVVSIDVVVREVCENVSAELRARRDADEYSTPRQDLPEILFEEVQAIPPATIYPYSLRLVLQNLIENAVKYSPRGGTITVRAWEESNELCVSITDQGIGIDPSRLDGLFNNPYQRGDGDTDRITGMGIGLDVVRRLMDAQSGRVWAHSGGKGKGATFSLAFPRSASGTKG